MKEGRDLTEADLASLLRSSTPQPLGLPDGSPGRRLFVRLVILTVVFVLAWFLVGEPMLAPLAERVRVHTAAAAVGRERDARVQ